MDLYYRFYLNFVCFFPQGTGYWYVFPEAPVGPSTGMAYQPGEAKNTPIWLFDNNVAHSVERVRIISVTGYNTQ